MVDLHLKEHERIREELATLRQLIMKVEPAVILDGRFEKMITSPLSIVDVACDLIAQIPELRALSRDSLEVEST